MKITSIRLTSGSNFATPLFDLPLTNQINPSQFILKDITGIEPPDLGFATIGYTSANTPIQNVIPQPRVVSIKIGLNPASGQDYDALRTKIYNGLVQEGLATAYLQLYNGSTKVAENKCTIAKVESSYLSQTPDVTVTLICASGVFNSLTQRTISVASAPSFTVNYAGTAPVGVYFQVKLNSTTIMKSIDITNGPKNWSFRTAGNNVPSNSTIILDSRPETKQFIANGSTLVDSLVQPSNFWPMLFPGTNTFTIKINEASTPSYLNQYFYYYEAYWGF